MQRNPYITCIRKSYKEYINIITSLINNANFQYNNLQIEKNLIIKNTY